MFSAEGKDLSEKRRSTFFGEISFYKELQYGTGMIEAQKSYNEQSSKACFKVFITSISVATAAS